MEKYEHFCILPHELVSACSADMRTAMSHSDLLEFWSRASRSEWYANHPYKGMIASSPSTVMPLRLHGDDCKGFTILSWCPVGREFSNRTLFTLWDHDSVVADIVEAEVASILCWSLHALGTGRWPDCDHLGRPWSKTIWNNSMRATRAGQPLVEGNLRAVLVAWTGDWKFYREMFGLAAHYNASDICFKCMADTRRESLHHFSQFHVNFPRRTEQYFKQADRPMHALPGMHKDVAREDWLHIGPLGTQASANGAALEEFALEGRFGNGLRSRRWKVRLNYQLHVAQMRF